MSPFSVVELKQLGKDETENISLEIFKTLSLITGFRGFQVTTVSGKTSLLF